VSAGKTWYCLNDLLKDQPVGKPAAPKPERKESLEKFKAELFARYNL
jgi:hypothetical protein